MPAHQADARERALDLSGQLGQAARELGVGEEIAVARVAHQLGVGVQALGIGEGDEVLVTEMEHHSNIVPWQMLRDATGATLRVAPVNKRGELLLDELESMLSERVKLLGIVHVSNALGSVHPVADMVARARQAGALTVIDGAQALAAAVQVLAYEWRLACLDDTPPAVAALGEPASNAEMEGFFGHLEQALDDIGFIDARRSEKLMRRLRRLFHRAAPDSDEVNILRGILSAAQGRKSMRRDEPA